MAVWLTRAGSHGEFEEKFIQENRVYLTWDELQLDLSKLSDRNALVPAITKIYPDRKPNTIRNWANQIWAFAKEIQIGDLIILPLKSQPAIQIGEVTGEYRFEQGGPNPYFHFRPVKWIGDAIPRANFSQDLLHSFGAFLTICRIQRNDAEARISAMRSSGWRSEVKPATDDPNAANSGAGIGDGAGLARFDHEEAARDEIAEFVGSRFKGHDLTRLVDAVLRAQGYTTYVSPPGPDGGADILAGAGPLGFSCPKLCVQVKSTSSPTDRPEVDKLLGVMTKFGAQEGLFVSWSGFKGSVQKELAQSFFRLRLWSQGDLLDAIFAQYDKLGDVIKAELPLKRIWTMVSDDE